MARNIAFDGNSLQTANILTQSIAGLDGLPNKTVPIYAISHANGSVIPITTYPSRTITVTGTIYGSTIIDLDQREDAFRAYFAGQDKNLDIDFAGGTRRFVATVNSLEVQRPGGLLFANFTIEFICTNPFGMAPSPVTILNATGRTGASYSDPVTFPGTAPAQKPIVTLTYTAVSGTSNQSVVLSNNANGGQITVTRVWANGDQLVVDSVLKQVTVNGILFDYNGSFPEFAAGAGQFSYSDSFTSRTFNYNIVSNPLYF